MKILVKNGLIYDGTGNAPFKSDVVIQDKKIARLGIFPKKDADLVLDATGMIITPGLIDINFKAEGPAGIVHDPYQEDLVRAGITTAIGGNEGISLAPILRGSTDFINEWGLGPRFNLHWRSMKEFLEGLGKRGVGVNFGTLIGYSPIRNFFTEGSERDLTLKEIESAKLIIGRALREGALGFSTDLASPHARRIPSREILELAREVAGMKRVYATHARHEDERFLPALEEILEVGRATGANMEINHLQPTGAFANLYKEGLALIEKETAQSRVNFDVFPHPVIMTPIYSFLPDWIMKGNMAEMMESLREKNTKERILKYLQKIKTEDLSIAEAPAGLKFLEGKSLENFAKNQGLTKVRAFFKLMNITGLRAHMFYSCVDKKVLDEFLANQRALISAGFHRFAGAGMGPGDFFARTERGAGLSLEKAIAKTTGLPAAKYGLEKRGLIKENYWADFILWENWKPKTVLINGAAVMRDGAYERKLVGSVLKAA